MYKLTIPKKQLSDLWRLREYVARGPIAQQVREAISDYLKAQEKAIGCPIADIEEEKLKRKKQI